MSVNAWVLSARIGPYTWTHSLEPGCVRKPHKVAEAVHEVTIGISIAGLPVENAVWSWYPYRRPKR